MALGVPHRRMSSVMKHSFSQVPSAQIQRSVFNRSHGVKTVYAPGYLIPIFVDEYLPGDTFRVSVTHVSRVLGRLSHPIMDNMWLDFFFFSVPCRLVWDNWKYFMGEHDEAGAQDFDYTVPINDTSLIGGAGYASESLYDYMGLPPLQDNVDPIALPFRCYNKIWNDWFREQSLQDMVTVDTDDGPDDPADYVLLRRNKRHDYFTACQPYLQKGTAVDLPLGSVAPVLGIGKENTTWASGPQTVYETGQSGSTSFADYQEINPSAANTSFFVEEDPDNAGYPGIYADLDNATAASINSLREAFQLQRMLERDARSGTRYSEVIRAHFGVTTPDLSFRSEYLGGGRTPLGVDAIPNTGVVTGYLNAQIYGSGSGISFSKSFSEHGYVIGMVCAVADLTYSQGVDRLWNRETREDFYFPALAHLGEQAVLNREIWFQDAAADDNVFGYQERWAEYRYKKSMICGDLRGDAVASLDAWHLSQDFAALPVLNSSFIQEDPPLDRVVYTSAENQVLSDIYFQFSAARPMPTFSVPGLIDHF